MTVFKFHKESGKFFGEFTVKEAAESVKSTKQRICKCLRGEIDNIKGFGFIVNQKDSNPTMQYDENELSYYMKRKLKVQHHSPVAEPENFDEDLVMKGNTDVE